MQIDGGLRAIVLHAGHLPRGGIAAKIIGDELVVTVDTPDLASLAGWFALQVDDDEIGYLRGAAVEGDVELVKAWRSGVVGSESSAS